MFKSEWTNNDELWLDRILEKAIKEDKEIIEKIKSCQQCYNGHLSYNMYSSFPEMYCLHLDKYIDKLNWKNIGEKCSDYKYYEARYKNNLHLEMKNEAMSDRRKRDSARIQEEFYKNNYCDL